jgi:hypothetical protein
VIVGKSLLPDPVVEHAVDPGWYPGGSKGRGGSAVAGIVDFVSAGAWRGKQHEGEAENQRETEALRRLEHGGNDTSLARN